MVKIVESKDKYPHIRGFDTTALKGEDFVKLCMEICDDMYTSEEKNSSAYRVNYLRYRLIPYYGIKPTVFFLCAGRVGGDVAIFYREFIDTNIHVLYFTERNGRFKPYSAFLGVGRFKLLYDNIGHFNDGTGLQ